MTASHYLTILAVRDIERAKRFYLEAFQWEVSVDVEVYVQFDLPGGGRIGLATAETFARNAGPAPTFVEPGQATATELYLRVDDLAAAIERMAAAGARPLSLRQPRDWGDEAIYFADPDGNVIALSRPIG